MNAIKVLLISIISIFSIACNASASALNGVYILAPETTVSIVGEISPQLSEKFIADLGKVKTPNKTLTFYIDSPGGSVIHGNRMIQVVRAHKKARSLKTVCLIEEAASMAFAFVQGACDLRVVTETSILMQHQLSFGVRDSIGKIEAMVALGRALERQLNFMQASRLGLSVPEFSARIVNDWYLLGAEAIAARAADAVGSWLCLSLDGCPLLPAAAPQPPSP